MQNSSKIYSNRPISTVFVSNLGMEIEPFSFPQVEDQPPPPEPPKEEEYVFDPSMC